MITGKEGLIEDMIEAFRMEKGTHEFYLKASDAAHEEPAKKAFRELAAWEEEHMGYLQFLYQAITEDRELLSFEDFKERARPEAVEGGIPMKKMEEKLEEYNFTDELGAIISALEMEAKSYSYYRRLSEKAEDPAAKVFLKEMMGLEAKHIEYIKQLRLKIEETS